ncbi:MAG: hypothetical protein LBR33_09310, partial [Propionibacteriaceae bacterium]|nr:hypothetical protein [Propionibacteriaceae bacterium]
MADPQPEYPVYLTALSLLPGLPLEEAVELLERRAGALRRDLARMAQENEQWQALIPDLMRVESAYQEAMAQAELAFTEKLVADIRGGAMTGL